MPRHELEQALEAANADPLVSGIMVYYPVFGNEPSFYGGSMDDYLRDTIAVEKDVEGLCYTYRNKLYRNQRYLDQARQRNKCILPCTPLSCVKILEHLGAYDASLPVGNRLDGRVITVINRSEIVGRPLAAMLANVLPPTTREVGWVQMKGVQSNGSSLWPCIIVSSNHPPVGFLQSTVSD